MPTVFPQSRAAWRKSVIRLMPIVALLLVAYFLLLGCAERSLLYPARYRPAPPPLEPHAGFRELAVTHERGKTFANLFLGDGVTAEAPGPLVIFSHGNGDLIEDFPEGLPEYRRLGVSVLLTEYRGCGRSDGRPNKTAIDADHVAFYDLAASQPEIDPQRIVFHGRSMGGGILASLATQRRPSALILESTYSSIRDYAARFLAPGFLVKDNFDVTATLRQYDGPVFFQHSPRDEVIPFWMRERNTRAYSEAHGDNALVVTQFDLGHNDPMPPQFFADVEAFFRAHGILPAVKAVKAADAD